MALRAFALPLPMTPMRNPLQEQLLKAGLVKKGKVAEVVREQNRQRKGKGGPSAADPAQVDVERIRAERAERDRALAAERNALVRANEIRAQVRQIVDHHKLPRNGDGTYDFVDGDVIKRILIDAPQRAQLAKGLLVIVRADGGYELLPRAAADKIRERDPGVIVLDHGHGVRSADEDELDEHYGQFPVPDDLVW